MAGTKPNDIFRKGSCTYFYSSVFFPKATKADVTTLYALVRTVDDFADVMPQQPSKVVQYEHDYERAWHGYPVDNEIVMRFVELAKRKNFEYAWGIAFFESMRMDISRRQYKTLDDTLSYMYGSAEVIGLMMARVLDLPKEAEHAARLLGRAMQYINFVRDIEEDFELQRLYFPQKDFNECGLPSLAENITTQYQEAFKIFMTRQLERYFVWQREAEEGFKYIPKRLRIPIRTASEMYKWTAREIQKDPYIVYRRKVKPSIGRIILQGLVSTFK